MQFCQPAFPGYAPNYNNLYNPPAFQYNGYPEIIGEGHVTSIMSPDGSIQYLFLPTNQWCRPQPCNPNFGNSNTQWNNNGAWFIRSAYPPMQTPSYQAMCTPSYQGACAFQSPPATSNSCIELHKANYQVKFHNDGCTSTSDIHYFYPTLRASNWFQKQRANSVCQTETTTTNSSSQDQEPLMVLCNQPCKCSDGNRTKGKVEDMSYSSNSNTSINKMSFENCTETKCQKYKTKKTCRKKRQKENNPTCGCYSKEDKTKANGIRICSSSNLSSAEKIALTKSEESDRKKKVHCKETKAICKCNDQPQTKGNFGDMSYSSNCNTSDSKVSFETCTETKCQKYKTKKSSKKKKPKESNEEDNTKAKVIRVCSSSNSSRAEKTAMTKSDEGNRKKKCKETKAICKCQDQAQTKVNVEDMSYSSNSNTSTSKISSENKSQKYKTNKSSIKKKPSNHTCACYTKEDKETKGNDKPQRVNKSVITFNDQGSNCKEKRGRETQTKFKTNTGSMTDINADDQAKKPVLKASYTICGDYESNFGTPSCSCCSYSTSETESDKRKPLYSKRKKTK